MKSGFFFLLLLIVAVSGFGQAMPAPNSRVTITDSTPAFRHIAAPRPITTPVPVETPASTPAKPENLTSRARVVSGPNSGARIEPTRSAPAALSPRTLSFGQIKNKIAEARRHMLTRPIQTASVYSPVATSSVRIAFFDWKTQLIDFVVIDKEAFLSKDRTPTYTVSTAGKRITATTIRANGVNTPVTLTDSTGQAQLPLLVQYPVEKGGRHIETAYYMSTHPGLVTPEVVNAGRLYVRNIIEIARGKLKEKGITIQPKLADIAERLATVEHVDHDRFRSEMHSNIYNDVFTLYALNEGQTYRYSVSSAGAGGMVQMIPATYRMVRSRYWNVALMPDFVEGMRNHVNATQAMLLYMQMTWNDLISRPAVTNAMAGGIASQEQLMAAGYNSNPARLAGYIDRGGAGWTNLIPRETKIYLQIYDSLERYVPMTPRTR